MRDEGGHGRVGVIGAGRSALSLRLSLRKETLDAAGRRPGCEPAPRGVWGRFGIGFASHSRRDWLALLLTVLGLCLFESVTSVDNAIINAEVLATMGSRARRWFLLWGILIAVFLVRGLLPWLIVWLAAPQLGPLGALTATFRSDPRVNAAVAAAAPLLLAGGGTFLVFLFFHWLFLEPKNYGLVGERFFHSQGVWFYAVVSVVLSTLVWFALQQDPFLAFGAVVGSTAFFIRSLPLPARKDPGNTRTPQKRVGTPVPGGLPPDRRRW
jgi:hypothetical protein